VSFCVLLLGGTACVQVRHPESTGAPMSGEAGAHTVPTSSAEVAAGTPRGAADEASGGDPAGEAAPERASASPTPSSAPAPTARAPKLVRAKLEVGDPSYTAGEVPKAKSSVEKLASKLEACVDDHGGLESAQGGSVELQFLVTARGVAEGVDLRKPSGVSADALRCMRDLLQKRGVGTPSTDPVGVTIGLRLRAAE
jgi:hypothetical protein